MTGRRYLVVFDLDDTLYPEREFVRGGLQAAATLLDPPAADHFFDEAWRLFDAEHRRGVRFILTQAVSSVPGEHHIDALEQAYRQHRPMIAPRPGMQALLERLRIVARMAVLSDGRHEEQKRKWQALGIQHLFDDVVFTDALGRDFWKPSPACFERLQQTHDMPAGRCLYVGDNLEKDFIAADLLGWRSVHFQQNDQLHCRKTGTPAEKTVGSVKELEAWLFQYMNA